MREIIIRVEDDTASTLSKDAKERGLTSEELCKYILGSHVKNHLGDAKARIQAILEEADQTFKGLEERVAKSVANIGTLLLKARARDGALTCKNCTIRLSEEDVESGKCGACGAPINILTGGE